VKPDEFIRRFIQIDDRRIHQLRKNAANELMPEVYESWVLTKGMNIEKLFFAQAFDGDGFTRCPVT